MTADSKSMQRKAGGEEEVWKRNTTSENEQFGWRKAGDTAEQNWSEVRGQGSITSNLLKREKLSKVSNSVDYTLLPAHTTAQRGY